MKGEIDVWRTARDLMQRCGNEAHVEAAMRAQERLRRCDFAGFGEWLCISATIDEVQQEERRRDAASRAVDPGGFGSPSRRPGERE